jgi:hypothetical protein
MEWRAVIGSAVRSCRIWVSQSTDIAERSLYFIGANDCRQQKSRLSDYRKFWKSIPALKSVDCSGFSFIETEVFSDGSDVRYATMAKVTWADVAYLAEWSRVTRCGCVLMPVDDFALTPDVVRDVYSECFGSGFDSVDYDQAIETRCHVGDVLMRFSGGFDDPDGAVDLIKRV